MSTTAFSSQGSQLKAKISGTYVLIPACKGILVPPTSPVYDDITNLDSPSGFPERIAVGKDFVSTAYELVWNPDNYIHRFLEDASLDQTQVDFEAVLSNNGAATYQWSAFVKWEPKAEARKAGIVTLTLDVTGAVSRTA
jgi:hypothetical protein